MEEVTIPISVANPEGLDAFEMEIEYPAELMEFQKVLPSEATKNWNVMGGATVESGQVRIGGFSIESLSREGVVPIAELVFVIRKNVYGRGELNVTRLMDDLAGTNVKPGYAEVFALPNGHALSENYPNPFNPATEIRYQISDEGYVALRVYNTLGQEVATLVDEVKEAGYHSVKWDASEMPSGVYFYRLTAGEFSQARRMVLMQ